MVISREVATTLRGLLLIDTACERVVFRAQASEGGVVVVGTEEDLEDLVASVAAEANHEPDRRRRKRLDAAYEALEGSLASRTLA